MRHGELTPAHSGIRREAWRLYRDDGEVVDVARLSRQPACLVSEQRGGQCQLRQSPGDTYALMWQWSGGGGVVNGFEGAFNGDLDQIDAVRQN